jgi:transposase
LLAQEKDISPAMNAAIKMLLLVIKLMVNRLGLNSSNSSKPPSSELNRNKKIQLIMKIKTSLAGNMVMSEQR